MRNKKLVSTVVASALVASTMAMPVMAADGEVNVDLTTKTGVLRVAVPTSMAIAVDQFQIENEDAQIASGKFTMENLSEIAVKVDVTSTVELGPGISLASSKATVGATVEDEAWLAAAAMTDADSYDIDPADATTENAWDLSEANDNVATFDATSKKANQTFYLGKASGAVSYKLAVPDATGKVGAAYAKFYELTAITNQPTDEPTLKTEADKGDVYAVATGDIAKDGASVAKIEKGSVTDSTSIWASGNTYYTMADEPTVLAASDSGKLFAYAAMATSGTDGKAGFTYIGKLSDKRVKWDDNDIKNIKIEYTINGVTASNYTEVAGDCTYGLYSNPVTAGLAYVSGKDDTDVVLQFTPPEGKTLATNFIKVNGVDASAWGSFATSFAFNTTNNTVTVKSPVFGFGSITGVTTNHKYTFVVKDSDGTEYSTTEIDLAP